jgi:peptide/nickel transport system permease protein
VNLRQYLLRRLLLIVPTFLGITLVTFLVIQLAPGDPAAMKLRAGAGGESATMGDKVTLEIVQKTRALYGLDRPIHQRYWIWLKRVATLDFGDSYKDGRRVMDKIGERLPVTLELNLISILLVYLIAVPLGVHSAVHQGSASDRAATGTLFVLYSLPNFWVAVLLIMFLGGGEWLNLFPVFGLQTPGMEGAGLWSRLSDHLWHLVLPVFCLTYGGLAALSRYQRAGMMEAIRADYVRTARAKGLPERMVIGRHAFRNSVIPVITLLGYVLPDLFGGSVVVESIFSIPGLGNLGFEAVLSRDYPVIMAIAAVSALLTLLGLLLSDLLYVRADPRITYESVS